MQRTKNSWYSRHHRHNTQNNTNIYDTIEDFFDVWYDLVLGATVDIEYVTRSDCIEINLKYFRENK